MNTTADTPAAPRAASGFDYLACWPDPSPDDAAAIKAFWRGEGALTDEAAMEQRVRQVVMIARTPQGEVAGVCTALATTPPRLAQPVWYWRTFVGARWRATPLVMSLLKRSCALLEDYAAAHGHPCIGILLELENERFRERGRAAAWFNPRFTYIGRSERGLDLRVLWFRGARLKPAATP